MKFEQICCRDLLQTSQCYRPLDGQTDGQTDQQPDSYIPPKHSFGAYNFCDLYDSHTKAKVT